MESGMGRATTEATIENCRDLSEAQHGRLPNEQVRRVTVTDAQVDTGAADLWLPTCLIQQLGLTQVGRRRRTGPTGPVDAAIYTGVRLTIQGRWCTMDVMEAPDSSAVFIGHIPLTCLDLVVNSSLRKLTGNPAHNGEFVIEQYVSL